MSARTSNLLSTADYHTVREAAAADILRVGKEDGETNIADLLTKVIVGQRDGTCVGTLCGNRWSP